jgi:CTP synthase
MRLREIGLEPNILVCRTEADHHLTPILKKKLGLFCNVETSHVIESPDVDTIYEIPLVLNQQKFDDIITEKLGLTAGSHQENLHILESSIGRYNNPKHSVIIAMCGKYNGLHDAYKSIIEAFIHSGIENNTQVKIKWVDTEKLEETGDISSTLDNIDGFLIPGGFGDRGIEGKIMVSRFARENEIPFFGICLGLQCSIIDFPPTYIPCKINDGTLKPQTDSKKRNLIFTRKPRNHYLSLNTSISKTTWNEKTINIIKGATDIPCFFQFFGIDPFYFYLGIIFNS